jgi:hypothetical protein
VNAIDNRDLFDVITLAGVRSPGVVTISGHDRKIGWDVKKAPGQSGASTTRTSEDPVEFTCSFYLVKDDTQGIDDIAAWPAFLSLIKSTVSGATPKALDIYHPDLVTNRIVSIVLSSFGGVVHDGKGGQTIAVKLQEYRPPKAAAGTPLGSKSKGPDPNQAAKDELAALTKKYQESPWG